MPNIPESHFRLLFDAAPESYLVMLPDEQFTMVFANRARSRITMTDPERIVGRGVFEVFPDNPDDPKATGVSNLSASLKRVIASGKPHTMATQRYDIKTPEGECAKRYWAPTNVPVLSSEGKVLYILHQVRDVTDLVSAAQSQEHERLQSSTLASEKQELANRLLERTQQLDLANDELLQSARRKDEFIATLAHELRNPLSAVYNAARLMSATSNTRDARLVEIVRHQSNVLRQMVDDLLDLSRIDRGLINFQYGSVDLVRVTEHAIEAARSNIYRHRHELKVTLPREPLCINGDAIRVEQVIVNLLNNAAKYTEPEGCIELHLKRHGSTAKIWVCDNGIGMSEDVLDRIFDLFGQAEQGLARSQGGLGIGLSVVKNLVEKHNGTITARSDGPGRGSKFCVSLPLEEGGGQWTASSSDAQTSGKELDILVVEDNVEVAETMELLLRNLGHHVAVAHDAFDAIESAKNHIPDVVLLDIGLPGIDGYELARRLKSHAPTQNIPLAALTGYGQGRDIRLAREAGIDQHFTKPVDMAALCAFFDELAESA